MNIVLALEYLFAVAYDGYTNSIPGGINTGFRAVAIDSRVYY